MAQRNAQGQIIDTNNIGADGVAKQENIFIADELHLQLAQQKCDVQDQLVNRDYEGDFFRTGDTVKVVAIDPNSVRVVIGAKDDAKPALDLLKFENDMMVIDKSAKYGFQISVYDRVEDKWNHESALTAMVATKMREAHNLETIEMILQNDNIPHIGTIANPITLTADADGNLGPALFRLVNAMKTHLKKTGAIDSNATYSFGANATTPLRGTAGLFIPPVLYRELLNSQYTRVDDVTEDVIRNGKYEKFAGFLLNECPELQGDDAVSATVLKAGDNTPAICAMIMGTKNLVTRASKVLPAVKQEDAVNFRTNYTGLEIYGERVVSPESGVIAFIALPQDEFTIAVNTTKNATTLGPVMHETDPRRAINEGVYANDAYLTAGDVSTLATKAELADHTHTIEAKAIDGTNPVTDIVLPVDEE